MPQKNIAFVQVPGGFSLGAFFHKTTAKLTELGYDAVEIDNPTVVDSGKPASFYDDAAHVHDVVGKFSRPRQERGLDRQLVWWLRHHRSLSGSEQS